MSMRSRTVLGLAAAFLLLLLAVACGGGEDGDTGASGDTGAGATGGEQVSGNVSVMGIWTGEEQKKFQAVIDAFNEQQPDVTVKYNAVGDNLPTVLSTAVEGGNPPDIADIAQPGLIQGFVDKGAAKPLDFMQDDRPGELRRLDRHGRDVQRPVLRPHVQGGQQVDSTGTTSRPSRTRASRRRTTGTRSSRTPRR